MELGQSHCRGNGQVDSAATRFLKIKKQDTAPDGCGVCNTANTPGSHQNCDLGVDSGPRLAGVKQ